MRLEKLRHPLVFSRTKLVALRYSVVVEQKGESGKDQRKYMYTRRGKSIEREWSTLQGGMDLETDHM